MRTTRKLVFVSLVAALLAAAPSSPVSAERQLRSGTIISGTGESPANFWVRGMEGCVGAPVCSAWLQSMCRPELARKNPAVHAAIVDVGKLADGVSERFLKVRSGVGINWGRYIVQFWTATDLATWGYCSEMVQSRPSDWGYVGGYRGERPFQIPRGAKWMTITASPDNTEVKWTLS